MSATALQLEGTSRGARSQLLFRQLNEQIRSIAFDGDLDVVCECVNGTSTGSSSPCTSTRRCDASRHASS
jgi:hypothetical protein